MLRNATPQTVKRAAIGARDTAVAIDPTGLQLARESAAGPMLATSTARPVEVAAG